MHGNSNMKFYLHIQSSGHMVRRQFLVSDAGIGARTRSCATRDEWNATKIGTSPSASAFHCQYLSSIFCTYLHMSIIPKYGIANSGDLQKYALSEVGDHWIKTCLHIFGLPVTKVQMYVCSYKLHQEMPFFIRVLNGNWDSDYTNLYFPWSFSAPLCKYLEDT